MISAELALDLAKRHEWARREVKSIDPISVEHPDLDLDDAYAVQQAWVDLQIADGAKLVGRKIGLTSRAMQQQMKIDEPDFGALLDYMVMPSGVELRHADFVDPKLEVEVAFVIGRRLSGDSVTVEEVLAATEYVQPALELIDARSYRVHPVTRRARTIVDTIADNAADAGVILGGQKGGRTMSTCVGSARSSRATAWSKRPDSPPACSAIRPTESPGSPGASLRTAWRSSPGRSSSPARSHAHRQHTPATSSSPTTALGTVTCSFV